MEEPEKPFACTVPDCGMTFTNEDHLHVHTKKHDMVLSLGIEQKAAFVADQTPTPTRFIRNCEEVGLFQDLQNVNVNPFDEGFKRAMETKQILSLESTLASSSDELHTPHFPLLEGDALYSTTNNQRNITISRSSSDESGAVKEVETTTISKLTNEVTTISRIVGKTEEKTDERNKDIRKDSVSYTNNVIKISNLVRKDSIDKNPVQTLIYEDTIIRDSNVLTKDIAEKVQEVPPIMSQKSLDFIVDSLNNEYDETKRKSRTNDEDYEVIIKLPNGKQVRMRAVEEAEKTNVKEVLKRTLSEKVDAKKNVQRVNNVNSVNIVPNVLPLAGTLIPVALVSNVVPKVPILPLKTFDKRPVKRKSAVNEKECTKEIPSSSSDKVEKKNGVPKDLESRSAASRRYRAKLKATYERETEENKRLRDTNNRLEVEKLYLQTAITEHLKRCPDAVDLKIALEKISISVGPQKNS